MIKRQSSTSSPRVLRGELAAAAGGGTPLPAGPHRGTPLPADPIDGLVSGPLHGTPLPAGPFRP